MPIDHDYANAKAEVIKAETHSERARLFRTRQATFKEHLVIVIVIVMVIVI
jgi:t-SNARE complex subunit (syntaxin)